MTAPWLLTLLCLLLNEAHAFLAPPRQQVRLLSPISASSTQTPIEYLTEEQLEFCKAYLNEHHQSDVLLPFVQAFTDIGATFNKKNMWMANSYSIVDANVTDVTSSAITMDVSIQEGDKMSIQTVEVLLDASPIDSKNYRNLPLIEPMWLEGMVPIDNFVRRINRLCNIVKAYKATGKMIQMGVQLGGAGVGKLNNDMYLNQVPHNRFVRKYFYDMASKAALDAAVLCSDKKISNRMKMTVMFPEMNPQMDSYRIGTLLELARSIAITLAEQNLRVRVCVQGSMGVGIFTGVPKQLNGVHTLLQRMDWESEPGEENEGMVGDYINFGFVGKEHVVNTVDVVGDDAVSTKQDDVFILLCPQNMVGLESSIIGPLSEMVDAAGDRPVILINPDLTDKISSQGQQSIRGRQQRLDFANSFETIYQFQNIYISGTSYFPILGSVVKLGPTQPWVAHQRRDLAGDAGEVYLPVYSSETKPDSDILMGTFEK